MSDGSVWLIALGVGVAIAFVSAVASPIISRTIFKSD